MLYEISQTQKEMLYEYDYMRYSWEANLWRYKVCRGWGMTVECVHRFCWG